MKQQNLTRIFLVDDDPLYLKRLEIEFMQHSGYEIFLFGTGEKCIERLGDNPDIIILDYELDTVDPTAMNGLDALDKIKAFDSTMPVVMLSQHDKIEIASSCMRHQAFEYVVKSETVFVRLLQIIENIRRFRKIERELNWYMDRM